VNVKLECRGLAGMMGAAVGRVVLKGTQILTGPSLEAIIRQYSYVQSTKGRTIASPPLGSILPPASCVLPLSLQSLFSISQLFLSMVSSSSTSNLL
jgi:TRAP-type C4-dicarboxylate transport system permease large subunit